MQPPEEQHTHSGQNINWVRTDPPFTSAVVCNACHLSHCVPPMIDSTAVVDFNIGLPSISSLSVFSSSFDWWIRRQRTPVKPLYGVSLWSWTSALPRTIHSPHNSSIHIDLHQFAHLHRPRWRTLRESPFTRFFLCESSRHLITGSLSSNSSSISQSYWAHPTRPHTADWVMNCNVNKAKLTASTASTVAPVA